MNLLRKTIVKKNLFFKNTLKKKPFLFYSTQKTLKEKVMEGPSLHDFINVSNGSSKVEEELISEQEKIPYLDLSAKSIGRGRKVFLETYGCQMNLSDSEIVLSILNKAGFESSEKPSEADVVLLNTCSIRDKAEQKIWSRLGELRAQKRSEKRDFVVGVLGCMAERLKDRLLESDKLCDLVVGPDAYRDLPNLLRQIEEGESNAINVMLSLDETYSDITPLRTSSNNVSAFLCVFPLLFFSIPKLFLTCLTSSRPGRS